MSLNERARAARSSVPRTGIRSSSWPADSRRAAAAASRIGTTTQRVTRDTMPTSSRTRTSPPNSMACWTRLSVACC